MEQQQVVKVHGARFGSGYLIAPRLVLTSAHLLGGDVVVTVPGSAREYAATVCWEDDHLDAALLEITAANWAPPATLRGHLSRRAQRWGRCVTGGTEIQVAALGFPRQQRVDEVRDSEQVVGRVRPHGGTTLEILDAGGPFGDGDPGRRWSGMSGAAVFPAGEELLLGVVRFDRQAHHGTRLTATRAEDLLAHPGFRAAVRRATGVDPLLEPVELAELLEPAPPMEVSSPTMLLRADAEVVSFHGRQDVLAGLEQWCLTDGPPSARVLTGPGGQGKTRVARRLMARLRDHGWVTGEVHSEPGELRVLRTVQHPLLLVVDYAESRPELVRRLWKQTERARHPVRLLLLARSLGSWKTKATGDLREIRLPALSPDASDREAAFRLAARDLAHRLADVTGRSDPDWPAIAATVPAPRVGAGAQTALTVQMAALVALLRQAPVEDHRPLEAELLDHENNHWTETAEGRGLGGVDAGRLAQAVATAVLCPALTEAEAISTLARVLPHEPRVADMAAWLRDLYPPPEGRYWGQLEPDRLGEYHAAEHVIDDPELLTRVFADAPDHQRAQTLTVLARAAVAHANEKRTDAARRVVERLRAVVRHPGAPLTAAMLRAHSDALPTYSHVLRDHALDVARELARLCRARGSDRDRGWALHNLAERQLAVGEWAGAVDSAQEATDVRMRLAERGATTHRAEWADSMVLLSRALRATGRRPEAHRIGYQALRLFRALAAETGEDGEKRERGLVRALLSQAQVVWLLDPESVGFDQIVRSDGYTDEALRRARDLAERYPDLDPILLTDALTQRSVNLWHLQRRPEALAPSEEAVETARRLAGENPDAYAGDLAGALMGLAIDYNIAGRPRAEAMALEREAIRLLRPLAADLPDVYGPTLARTLHNLAIDQHENHDDGAWESMVEAVHHREAALADPHGIGLPELGAALHTLATFHAGNGDHQSAVSLFEQALEHYESSPLPLSASALQGQSGTVLELARSYEALGRLEEALTAAKRANTIRRRLSEYGAIYTESYAASLRDISDLHRRQDRRLHERIVLRHALTLNRRLAAVSEEGREGLAICLADLGASYAASWPTAGRAVTALTEAYELFASLPLTEVRRERNIAIAAAELSGALLKTSRFAEAARVAEDEVRLRRRLLSDDPAGEEWPLYSALLRQAEGLSMAGRTADAWRTVLQAEQACHALAARPDLTRAQVALLHRTLARAMSLCGRHDVRLAARALAPARRAARICRELEDAEPGAFQIDLRLAVGVLEKVLTRLGRHTEAAHVRLRRGA